jgi:hypothetical protein
MDNEEKEEKRGLKKHLNQRRDFRAATSKSRKAILKSRKGNRMQNTELEVDGKV